MPSFHNIKHNSVDSVLGGDGVWRSNDLTGTFDTLAWSYSVSNNHTRAGFLQFKTSRVEMSDIGTAKIYIERVGGFSGAVGCTVKTNSTVGDMSMTSGTDFIAISEEVSFADNEAGVKSVTVSVTNKPRSGLNIIVLTMDTATGGVTLRNPEMHIYLDDGGVNPNATIITAGGTIQSTFNAGSSGDLFYLRGGTYTDNTRTSGQDHGGYYLSTSGTQFAKKVISAYPSETPIIDQNYDETSDSLGLRTTVGFLLNCAHVHIKGIEIKKTLWCGIVTNGGGSIGDGIVVEDCHIHDIGNPPSSAAAYNGDLTRADNIGGTSLDGSTKAIQRFNTIHNIYDLRVGTGTSNPFDAYAASMHSGIHGFDLTEAWIHNNDIYQVSKGVFQKNPSQSTGIGHRVHNNDIREVSEFATSFQVAGSGQIGALDVHVYNNLFELTHAGSATANGVNVDMLDSDTTNQPSDFWIWNNTQIDGAELYAQGDVADVVVFNNILQNASATISIGPIADGNTLNYCDYNCYNSGVFRVLTDRYGTTNTYSTLTTWRAAYPTDVQLLTAPDGNTITTAPTFINSGARDYTTSSGVSVGTGRFNRDIGIGLEVVGV